MKIGDRIASGTVIHINPPYYITERSRPMDDEKLYSVYKDTDYWRDIKFSKTASIHIDYCINWIITKLSS